MIRKLFITCAGLFLALPSLAAYHPPIERGVAATINFALYDPTTGGLDVDEVDGGTEVTIFCDNDAGTTATNDFADEGSFYSIALTSGETACAVVVLQIAATDTEVVIIPTIGASGQVDAYPANVTQFGGSAGTFASGIPDVNTEQWNNVDLDTTNPLPNAAADGAGGLVISDAGGLDIDNRSLSSGSVTTLNSILGLQTGSNGAYPMLGIIASGTAQLYTSGTPSVTLASSTAMADDDLNGATILVVGSNEGDWQAATINDYAGSTDIATIDAAFSTAPTGTISYIVFGTASGSGLDAAGVRAAVGLASANLDTQLSTAQTDLDTLTGSDGVTLATTQGNYAPATAAALATAQTDLDTITGSDGVTLATTQGNYAPATPAQVNAEVVDVLTTDTHTQPGAGAPAATEDLADMISYLYKAWRNRSTQTATTYTLYNDDASTAEHQATVSDDATTFTKGEVGAVP